ncbi:hypothetical protein A0H81_10913 [Grifola frondosa]|uniref:Uncharacterized protein n=1 Tax=Grifola frondosa TaxID=5627 RepID=A0A1C7LY62_GRIFR|nr:hypothetical protein A0H81_10913 [Grifola frondosa]
MYLLGLFAHLTGAVPILDNAQKRDVYVPPVLYPHNGTVWTTGQHHNVTWDGDLSTPLVLAANFSILLGRIEVTVPWVLPDIDYSIVLFGDSGNFSPQFTITGPAVF